MPMQTSHTFELGGSPSCPIAQLQNIFVRVRGWTCTSIPITISHSRPTPPPSPRRGEGAIGLPNARDLNFHAARHLVGARDAQRDVLAPLRREHLQPHR